MPRDSLDLELVCEFHDPVMSEMEGRRFRARVLAALRPDGEWDGCIEFSDAEVTLLTPRETTQTSILDLKGWASRLSPVYLSGALERAMVASAGGPGDELNVGVR